MEQSAKISVVTKRYIVALSLTQEQFADALNSHWAKRKISRVAVTHWCGAKTEPSTDFLLSCAVAYHDWRHLWAMSCLGLKLPDVFDGDSGCSLKNTTFCPFHPTGVE